MSPPAVPPRRILVVCQHYWPESFRITDLVSYFVERGVEVDVLCGLPNYPSGEFSPGFGYRGPYRQRHEGADILRVPEIRRGDNSNARIGLNFLSFPAFSLLRVPQLARRRYDAVFAYQLSPVMMSIAAVVVARLKHVPLTMYVLDLWPENLFSVIPLENGPARRLLTRHSHWYYRRADRLVALSSRMAERLAEVTSHRRDDIRVLPQACEKLYETTIPDAELETRFAGTFRVVFTGNISPAQSFGTMVEAARLLVERGFADVRWVIVGDGMSRAEAEESVRRAGVAESFSFEGMVPMEDVPRYTHLADVLVGCLVTSELLEATVPAKVFSYIASGRPVVLAMDGEVKELIEDRIGCGFVGPTEDAATLAENIARIHALTTAERRELGESARRYHHAHLSRDLILAELYDIVLGPEEGGSSPDGDLEPATGAAPAPAASTG